MSRLRTILSLRFANKAEEKGLLEERSESID